MKILWAIIPILLLLDCGADNSSVSAVSVPKDDWNRCAPEVAKMDSSLLYSMLLKIQRDKLPLHSILIYCNDRLVMEGYFPPYTSNDSQIIFSSTKSILSLLLGIAIDRGHIQSVLEEIAKYLPSVPSDKTNLTIQDLLTMRAGIQWNAASTTEEMLHSSHWTEFVLSRSMIDVTKPYPFNYNNGAAHLIATIIENAAGQKLDEFANEYLFNPLGITNWYWTKSPEGVASGFSHLVLQPVDLLKIGRLLLQQGVWNGRQIVSADWIAQSTLPYAKDNLIQNGYGYFWRINTFGGYRSQGFAGQYLFVIPQKNLAVVFTGGLGDKDYYVPLDLVKNYLLPSIKTDALPENPVTNAMIGVFWSNIQNPPFIENAKEMNEPIFMKIEKNPQNLIFLSLDFRNHSQCLLTMGYRDYTNAISIALDGKPAQSMVKTPDVMNNQPRLLKSYGFWKTSHFIAKITDIAEGVCFTYNFEFSKDIARLSIKPDIYYYRLDFRGKIQ